MRTRSRPIVGFVLTIGLLAAGCSSGSSVDSAPASAAPPSPTPAPATTAAVTASAPASSVVGVGATIVSSTPLPGYPGGPATGSQALWYWDESTGDVVRLDTATGQLVASVPLGDPAQTPYGSPKTVVASGGIVWVTDVLHHAVARIDPATNTVVKRIALDKVGPPGATAPLDPFGLALDGSSLWVSDFDRGLVASVDTTTGTVTTVVPGIDHPEGLAVGFGSVWVVEHRKGAIARIDPVGGTVSATIALPGTGPQAVCGMCVDNVVTSSDSVWVPLDFGNSVVRINPATNLVTAQVPFDRVVDSLAVDGAAVWAAAWDGSIPCTDTGAYAARIDSATNQVTGTQVVPCAVTVAVAEGDVWVGTADAPNGVTRLHIGP